MVFLPELSAGDRLGAYTIVKKLDEGGMGVIYEVKHDHLKRPTVIKALSSWLSSGLGRARFEREVQASSLLQHENTVTVYDHGETSDGRLYYAMEHLNGLELDTLVALEGPQSPGRVMHILVQILGALEEAHDKGLLHRDIKPGNILLCHYEGAPDVAKLLDFGLALPFGRQTALALQPDQSALQPDRTALGTPRYAAPELLTAAMAPQLGGHHDESPKLGPGTDLYALALVAYFLLKGEHFFEPKHPREILKLQRADRGSQDAFKNLGLSDALKESLDSCLRFAPEERPSGAAVLKAVLETCTEAPFWSLEEADTWWENREKRLSSPG